MVLLLKQLQLVWVIVQSRIYNPLLYVIVVAFVFGLLFLRLDCDKVVKMNVSVFLYNWFCRLLVFVNKG